MAKSTSKGTSKDSKGSKHPSKGAAKDAAKSTPKQGHTSSSAEGGAPDRSGAGLRSLLRIPPHSGTVDLMAYDPAATPGGPKDKKHGLADIERMRPRLAELQERLFASSVAGDRRRLLLILQGMDTSGKGGTLKHVVTGLNPAGVRVRAFKAPTAEELRHPFLWRIRNALPHAGEIGVFDRSHYEDVLVAPVRRLVPRAVWSRRYATIDRFERSLADEGVTVVKVFLHIGYPEQGRRLLARLDEPAKHWKFNPGDIEDRELWPAYQAAYQTVLERCSTENAPWYLVPADHKWYRNWAISRLLLEHLEELAPSYPEADFDVAENRRLLLATT
ncbi:PPK2 family polyphosphate kinase [Streptomyces sp. NBC_01190]|uniref:PPK2 family polyphosphate kinase n=1 Tax=Streptomyces sp. NBC_01190 TaxID=2903767 RepID=UPI003864FA36|nr:polyphosphate kinase 2 family protein [Streptomyces sp. NBC_01190]